MVTSHWHSDHTGGLLSFLKLRGEQVQTLGRQAEQCVVDVHPDRPIARGIAPRPNFDTVACALTIDPTFKEIEEAGGVVEKHGEAHTVAGGTVWVSGEIPRVTEWETGIPGGSRWIDGEQGEKGRWISESVSNVRTHSIGYSADTILVPSTSWTSAMSLSMSRERVSSFSARKSFVRSLSHALTPTETGVPMLALLMLSKMPWQSSDDLSLW